MRSSSSRRSRSSGRPRTSSRARTSRFNSSSSRASRTLPGISPPPRVDTIEYDYLEGAPSGGPTLETREGWDIDGQEYKAREEFTATPIDWRGLVKNPGALPPVP
jgi:hypothetical protein